MADTRSSVNDCGQDTFQNNNDMSQIKEQSGHGDTVFEVVGTNSQCDTTATDNNLRGAATKQENSQLIYRIDETPPWYLCLLLGLQHYLTAFASTFAIPLVLAGPLCFGKDMVGLSELIASFFFVAGIATLLQSTVGIRLPIIQGASFAYVAPTVSILNMPELKCPEMAGTLANATDALNVTMADEREVWQSRLRQIQGAICVVSLLQILIGCSGVLGILLRYVGPLTITPTITLIGLSLFEFAPIRASSHWWIAITTVVLMAVFSEYLSWVKLPLPNKCAKKDGLSSLPVLKLFPILLAIMVSWLLCLVLTVSGALTDDPKQWGYRARTDINTDVIRDSAWFRLPYPGQWGMPTFNPGAVAGMVAGVIASVIESIGDYYACARFSEVPSPPSSAVNRGIMVEGIGCVVAGLIGTGNATTSYSQNVGAIGLTKVASLRVIQCAGLIFLFFGCIGKLGAVFVTIPDPVAGGLFLFLFGIITAVGLSNLQYVNLNSSRNLFVIGTSLFVGLAVPYWIDGNEDAISTGVDKLDQILHVLLSTSMLMGGCIGFLLDITLPGTPEERGLIKWVSSTDDVENAGEIPSRSVYDVPYLSKLLSSRSWMRYIPVCPASDENRRMTSNGNSI